MKVDVYNTEGKKTSSKELSADVFGIEPNDHAIYLDVKRYLAAHVRARTRPRSVLRSRAPLPARSSARRAPAAPVQDP